MHVPKGSFVPRRQLVEGRSAVALDNEAVVAARHRSVNEAQLAGVEFAPPRELPIAEPRRHEARSVPRRSAPVSSPELVSVGGGSRAQRARVVDKRAALALEEVRVQPSQVSRRVARTGLPDGGGLRAPVGTVIHVPLLVASARAPAWYSCAARAPEARVRLRRPDGAHAHGGVAPCRCRRVSGSEDQRADSRGDLGAVAQLPLHEAFTVEPARATLLARASVALANLSTARGRGFLAGHGTLDERAAGAAEDWAQHPCTTRDAAGLHAPLSQAHWLRAPCSDAARLVALREASGAAHGCEVRHDPHGGLVAADVMLMLLVGHSLNVGQRLSAGRRPNVASHHSCRRASRRGAHSLHRRLVARRWPARSR